LLQGLQEGVPVRQLVHLVQQGLSQTAGVRLQGMKLRKRGAISMNGRAANLIELHPALAIEPAN
jgi:hypothetical protein